MVLFFSVRGEGKYKLIKKKKKFFLFFLEAFLTIFGR